MPVAPAARVQRVESTRSSPQAHRNTRHSLRNGFNGLFRALPGDEFVLSPSLANCGISKPGWARFASASLTPATGARTTRLCRPRLRRSSARRSIAHKRSSPCDLLARRRSPRPPHPIPTFVTMANVPLPGRDGEKSRDDLGRKGSGIFLKAGLDRANHHETVTENRASRASTVSVPGADSSALVAAHQN